VGLIVNAHFSGSEFYVETASSRPTTNSVPPKKGPGKNSGQGDLAPYTKTPLQPACERSPKIKGSDASIRIATAWEISRAAYGIAAGILITLLIAVASHHIVLVDTRPTGLLRDPTAHAFLSHGPTSQWQK
jgi:hypothetical protein